MNKKQILIGAGSLAVAGSVAALIAVPIVVLQATKSTSTNTDNGSKKFANSAEEKLNTISYAYAQSELLNIKPSEVTNETLRSSKNYVLKTFGNADYFNLGDRATITLTLDNDKAKREVKDEDGTIKVKVSFTYEDNTVNKTVVLKNLKAINQKMVQHLEEDLQLSLVDNKTKVELSTLTTETAINAAVQLIAKPGKSAFDTTKYEASYELLAKNEIAGKALFKVNVTDKSDSRKKTSKEFEVTGFKTAAEILDSVLPLGTETVQLQTTNSAKYTTRYNLLKSFGSEATYPANLSQDKKLELAKEKLDILNAKFNLPAAPANFIIMPKKVEATDAEADKSESLNKLSYLVASTFSGAYDMKTHVSPSVFLISASTAEKLKTVSLKTVAKASADSLRVKATEKSTYTSKSSDLASSITTVENFLSKFDLAVEKSSAAAPAESGSATVTTGEADSASSTPAAPTWTADTSYTATAQEATALLAANNQEGKLQLVVFITKESEPTLFSVLEIDGFKVQTSEALATQSLESYTTTSFKTKFNALTSDEEKIKLLKSLFPNLFPAPAASSDSSTPAVEEKKYKDLSVEEITGQNTKLNLKYKIKEKMKTGSVSNPDKTSEVESAEKTTELTGFTAPAASSGSASGSGGGVGGSAASGSEAAAG